MGSTFRLAWVRDGAQKTFVSFDGAEYSTPDGKKFAKRMNRKRARMEHHNIERNAVREFYAEKKETYDWLMFGIEPEDELSHSIYELARDYEDENYLDYDPIDYYEDDCYGSYHDDWSSDYSYMDDWYSSRAKQPEDRIIKPEDCGKSLGELLAEAIVRRKELSLNF